MKKGRAPKPNPSRAVRKPLCRYMLEGRYPYRTRILPREAKVKGQQIQMQVSCSTVQRELQFMLFWRHHANPEDTELGKEKDIHKIGTLPPKALFQITLKQKYLRYKSLLQHLFQPALGQNKRK